MLAQERERGLAQEMAEEVELLAQRLAQGREAAVSQASPTVLAAAQEQVEALVLARGLVLDSERMQGVAAVPPWAP